MQRNLPPLHYSALAVILHWLLAFALAFQMGLGWHMSEMQNSQSNEMGLFAVTQFHKSVGILILLASIARLILRIYKKPPNALNDDAWAHRLSQYTHIALYIFMIGMPLSGWLMVSTSDLNIDTYIFEALYWPHIPGIESLSEVSRLTLNMVSSYAHEILSWAGILLFFLHVAGALRHQYFKDEAILWRILPLIKPLGKMNATLCIFFIISTLMSLFIFAQFSVNSVKSIKTISIISNEPETSLPLIEEQSLSIEDSEIASLAREDIKKSNNIEETQGEDQADIDQADTDQANDISKAEVSKIKAIQPSNWTVIGSKSLGFTVKWNDDVVTGNFSDWNADIKFTSAALDQSSIKILINLMSVTTSDSTVNGAIGSADYFNFSGSSQAQYSSNSIKSLGGNRYQMDGVLLLKNIERPLRINFTLDENENNARATGYAKINRIAHNIGVGQDEIANDVRVDFDFTAKK